MQLLLKDIATTSRAQAPDNSPESPEFGLILRRLERPVPAGRPERGPRLLGISGLLALPLYHFGMLGAHQALALALLAWLGFSRREFLPVTTQGTPRGILPRILLQSLDLCLLLAAGWSVMAAGGGSGRIVLLAAAAGLSSYLAYYSGVALLKAIPGRVRLAAPGALVALDHKFLSHTRFWGGEREIALGLTALGLFAGFPAAGLIAAIVAGNLNWLLKAGIFWREVHDAVG